MLLYRSIPSRCAVVVCCRTVLKRKMVTVQVIQTPVSCWRWVHSVMVVVRYRQVPQPVQPLIHMPARLPGNGYTLRQGLEGIELLYGVMDGHDDLCSSRPTSARWTLLAAHVPPPSLHILPTALQTLRNWHHFRLMVTKHIFISITTFQFSVSFHLEIITLLSD